MKTVFSRTIPLVFSPFALAAAVLSLSPLPAQAASGGINVATLTQPLAAPKQEIIGEALWKCAGDRCVAANSGGRHAMTCQRVAKKFGEVARFNAGGSELSADDLAKCNGK